MLYLSTVEGVFSLDPDSGASTRLGPDGASTEALAVAGEVIVAALTPDYGLPMRRPLRPAGHGGAVRSSDGGRTWQPVAGALAQAPVTALAAAGDTLWAGTDPAEVFVSHDGGQQWMGGQSLRTLPGYAEWAYPLPPHTPHVMTIVPHPVQPDVVYAGIEVGGIIRSDDGGQSWRVIGVQPGAAVHPDIHGLAICTAQPHVLYAATPQGIFYSEDGGERWEQRIEGLEPLYCRPVAVHPRQPECAVTVATYGASGFFGIAAERTGGQVFWTEDGGRHWQAAHGLPAALQPTPALVAEPSHPGRLWLPLFSGQIFTSDDAGQTWREVARGLPPILRLVARAR
jgi:photosystem II stability/assembly factor-like uncharacterized protein